MRPPAPVDGPTRTSFLSGLKLFLLLDWVRLARPKLLCLASVPPGTCRDI